MKRKLICLLLGLLLLTGCTPPVEEPEISRSDQFCECLLSFYRRTSIPEGGCLHASFSAVPSGD